MISLSRAAMMVCLCSPFSVQSVLGQSKSPVELALTITEIRVTRPAPARITIRYTLKNTSNEDVFVPCIETPEVSYIPSFTLLHHSISGQWISIQGYFDVPASKAKVIKPGGVLTLSEELSDPATYRTPGNRRPTLSSTPLEGTNMLRVGYFRGSQAWKARQGVVGRTHDSRAMPAMEFAESDEFVVKEVQQ